MFNQHITHSLYSSHKAVLAELVEEARIHYLQASVSRVTIHMTDGVRFSHHNIQERFETYPPIVFVDEINDEIPPIPIYIDSS